MTNSFHSDLQFSKNEDTIKILKAFYRNSLKAIHIEDIPDDDPRQKEGIDRIITRQDGTKHNIDEKIRAEHYDDILVEITANTNTGSKGWAVDDTKKTDFIVYVTDYIYVVKYKKLREFVISNLDDLMKTCSVITSDNSSYDTENLIIPYSMIEDLYVRHPYKFFDRKKEMMDRLRKHYKSLHNQ
jgi:hypothetical protein